MPGAQVLRDPKQKRFFKSKDIHDLFTMGPQYAGASETASIFSSLHGGLDVPLDPDAVAVPAESAQPAQAGERAPPVFLLIHWPSDGPGLMASAASSRC